MSRFFENRQADDLIAIWERQCEKFTEQERHVIIMAACQIARWERIIRGLQRHRPPGWKTDSVSDLGMKTSTLNLLKGQGISTLGDLVQQTPDDLLEIRGIGMVILDRIRLELVDRGLWLKDDDLTHHD